MIWHNKKCTRTTVYDSRQPVPISVLVTCLALLMRRDYFVRHARRRKSMSQLGGDSYGPGEEIKQKTHPLNTCFSKSRLGLGVGILAMVSLGVMGSVWLRAGGDGNQQIDDHGHVMVEPMTNPLPLNPMPNPKNAEEGLSRELAKLIPYRMYMMGKVCL